MWYKDDLKLYQNQTFLTKQTHHQFQNEYQCKISNTKIAKEIVVKNDVLDMDNMKIFKNKYFDDTNKCICILLIPIE